MGNYVASTIKWLKDVKDHSTRNALTELLGNMTNPIRLNLASNFEINGTTVTATADELNAMAGNGLSAAELGVLDGVTAGTVTASKAAVVDANKDIGDFRNLDAVNIDAGASGTAGSVDVFPATASKGKLAVTCADQIGNTTVTLNANAMGQATQVNIPDPGAAAGYVVMTTAALALAEADVLQSAVAGTVVASKAVVVDANKDVSAFRNVIVTNLDAGASGTAGTVDVFPATASKGKLSLTCTDQTGDTAVTVNADAMGQATTIHLPDPKEASTYVALANTLATEAGAGITGGTGTVYKSSVVRAGGIVKTSILLDLTGLSSSATDLDIIGQGVSVAHIGQITAARNGTVLTGRVTCLEVPAGGVDDIDLYAANEGTGVFDSGVGDLTETALVTSGGAWALGAVKVFAAVPAANDYLYLTCGAAGTAATYTAGKFLIEIEGYDA